MLRAYGKDGIVHFLHPTSDGLCLCGCPASDRGDTDLFGATTGTVPFKKESVPVTCIDCATVYCAVKNQPWGGGIFEDTVLEKAIVKAVEKE